MKTFYFLIFVNLLSSCAGYSTINYSNRQSLNNENLQHLSGNYDASLWNYLAPLSIRLASKDTNDYKVSLEVINQKHIQAKLKYIQRDSVIDTRKIKGKIENGFFSVRRKVYPLGLPPLFFKYYESKLELALTKEDELYLEAVESRFGWAFLLLTGGHKDNFNKIYRKE